MRWPIGAAATFADGMSHADTKDAKTRLADADIAAVSVPRPRLRCVGRAIGGEWLNSAGWI